MFDRYILLTDKQVNEMVLDSMELHNEVCGMQNKHPDMPHEDVCEMALSKWFEGLDCLYQQEDGMWQFEYSEYLEGRFAPVGNKFAMEEKAFRVTQRCDTCDEESVSYFFGMHIEDNFDSRCNSDDCNGSRNMVARIA